LFGFCFAQQKLLHRKYQRTQFTTNEKKRIMQK
jgi:hypothetical protein